LLAVKALFAAGQVVAPQAGAACFYLMSPWSLSPLILFQAAGVSEDGFVFNLLLYS
jgi:hypothetical protein